MGLLARLKLLESQHPRHDPEGEGWYTSDGDFVPYPEPVGRLSAMFEEGRRERERDELANERMTLQQRTASLEREILVLKGRKPERYDPRSKYSRGQQEAFASFTAYLNDCCIQDAQRELETLTEESEND